MTEEQILEMIANQETIIGQNSEIITALNSLYEMLTQILTALNLFSEFVTDYMEQYKGYFHWAFSFLILGFIYVVYKSFGRLMNRLL